MADQVTLAASRRSTTGKGAARTLRRTGRVPAVIYGHHREAEALTVDAALLQRALVGVTSSTVLAVSIDGAAPVAALIRELQRDPVRRQDIIHVDLLQVQADEAVRVTVPVRLVGTSDGVRNGGGVLEFLVHTIELEILPADIPDHLDLDISGLGLGQSLHVSDVVLPKGRVLTDPSVTICAVLAPRSAEATPGEGAPTEPELIRKAKGDEGAEG